jgi:plasmid stabilization system protein ParE
MARKVIWAYAAEEDLEAAASYTFTGIPLYMPLLSLTER